MFQETARSKKSRVSQQSLQDDGFKLMKILFDSISTPMVFTDETGRVLAVNVGLTRTLGWRKRELLGKNIRKLIHDQCHPAFFQLQRSLRRDEQSRQRDLDVLDKEKKKRKARFRVQRVQLNGQHVYSISIHTRSDGDPTMQNDPLRRVDQDLLRLTPTETEVCRCIQEGMSSKEIAERMCSSFETIQTHRKNIRKKMGLNGSKTPLCTYLRVKKGLFWNS